MIYMDRRHAGVVLARALTKYANEPDVCVLALPRGGVPVGFEVAFQLDAPLDVFLVGKLGVPDVSGKTVILVDDCLATGTTMRSGITALRRRGAKRIVMGVPVAPESACREIRDLVDEIVCVYTPEPFFAVGAWYQNFDQITDDEVRELLEAARSRQATAIPSKR